MFTAIQTKTNPPRTKGTIGYTVDNNEFYIYSHAENIFIHTELHYKLFSNIYDLTYYINVIPRYRRPKNTSLNFEIYKGTFNSSIEINIYSSIPFNVVAGQYLDTPTTHAVVDFSNNKVTTEHGSYVVGVLNYDLPVHFENPPYVPTWLLYVDKGMTTTEFWYKRTSLLHPLSLGYLAYLEQFFINNPNATYNYRWDVPEALNLSHTVVLNPVRILLSPDNEVTWYTYNKDTNAFNVVTPVSTYITMDELNTSGMSFSTFSQITDVEFATLNSEKFKILTNGYLFPQVVRHSYWTSVLDVQDYLWISSNDSKCIVLSGLV